MTRPRPGDPRQPRETLRFRHMPLVHHALGVKLALDLHDHRTAYAELVALVAAVTSAQTVLGIQPTPASPLRPGRATYTPAEVKRTGTDDATEVQHVTTAKLRSIGTHERARGHRQGQQDLALSLGYGDVDALARAVRRHTRRPIA